MNRSTRARALRASALLAVAVACSVPAAPLMADINGFATGSGTGPTQYTLNGNQLPTVPAIDTGTNTLTITTPNNNQASSAFYNTKQSVLNFTAEFDYTVTSGQPTADGFAFVLQNDPRGTAALGAGGGTLAYGGTGGITKSVALAADLYNGAGTSANPTRVGHAADGGGFAYSSSAPVELRNGSTYHFKVQQDNGAFNATITNTADATQTFTAAFNRNVANRVGPTAYVGFTGATGGANAGQNLSNFKFTTGTAPAAPAAGPLITGVPQGGAGFFGVREVTNNNNVGNLTDVTDSLANNRSGTRRVVDYTAPSLDIYDSDVRGNFTNDRPFASAASPGPGVGNVDNLALVATGTIRVPTTGNYTFAVKSDDGFRLSIGGQRFEAALGQGGTAVNANGALEFTAGRGAGDISLGQIYLPAGDHPIQLLYWEGGGGSSLELSSSGGLKGGFDATTFNLVGAPATSVPGRAGKVAGMGSFTYTPYTNSGSLQNVLDTFRNRGGTATAGTVTSVKSVHFVDPENPNNGSHGADAVPFPGNTPADDNNFGGVARGTLTISAANAGPKTFAMYSDDQSAFRILRTDGTAVPILNVDTSTTDIRDSDGDGADDEFGRFTACCGDFLASYNLDAGTYTIEAGFTEGGGGSSFFIYAANGDLATAGFNTTDFDLLGGTDNLPVPAGLQLVAVPEPGTAAALGLAALGMLGARRRRRAR